jgi:2,4-dienoyl-CoA reductase-like NADH-dependent reductase (Old Yellow Enzyme family)
MIHQFLSPLSNQRKDNYGGSFENRIRLLLEIVEEIQTVWPENLPLFVRISATDWAENGWDINESVQLSSILKLMGVDLIDTSSGGLVPGVKIPLGPGYQVSFAKRIKRETGILTGAVGLITEAKQAEDILVKGQADLIFIARASLRYPYFALHAAKDSGDDIDWPLQYSRAKL